MAELSLYQLNIKLTDLKNEVENLKIVKGLKVAGQDLISQNTGDIIEFKSGSNIGFDVNPTNKIVTVNNTYSHPATHGAGMILEDPTHRFFTDEERNKLQGVESGANKYIHPDKHPANMIVDEYNKRWMLEAERAKLQNITDGATKVQASTTNGNVLINGLETQVYVLDKHNHTGDQVTTPVNEAITAFNIPIGAGKGNIWIE